MRSTNVVAALLCLLLVSIPGFSQIGNAQLTGVVTDQSGALIPGVTITMTKSDTGVVTTTVTNEAGVYNFPALQPGTGYTVSAALPGFQTLRYTNLELNTSTASRQNFQLQVASQTTTVEVSIDRQGANIENSPSVGTVLPEYQIRNMPLVGNNVLDLLNILPGVRFNGTGSWMGDYANTVGGQGLNSLNVTLDGLPMRDERFSAQAGNFQGENLGGDGNGGQSGQFGSDYTGGNRMLSTTTINPDLVGEIKLILSPVDAEMGRGNSQIQITTRSGTNRYTGSAVWNIQNTGLNPNTWNNNNALGTAVTGCKIAGQTPPNCWNPVVPDWRNTHQYTVSFGGPIIRNKTFFYFLWDQQISSSRTVQTPAVLTDSARNGIFRFWEGWAPGDADDPASAQSNTAANPTIPSVDYSGNPLSPLRIGTTTPVWPNGAAYNGTHAVAPAGRLVCFSVFGTQKADGSPFGAADCPSGTDVNGIPYIGLAVNPPSGAQLWDAKRPDAITAAQMGYFLKLVDKMPRVNDFTGGDGLNTSTFRWLRGRKGNGDTLGAADTLVGAAAYTNRKQFNIKIDQNLRQHRFAGNWTHQWESSTDPAAAWPNGLGGITTRGPHTFSVNATSTFSSSLLNEARFGLNLNKANSIGPWDVSDSAVRDLARSFMLQGGQSRSGNGSVYDVLIDPGAYDGAFLVVGGAQNQSFSNPLFNFADTISWSKGKHSFKFGADLRFPRSRGNSLQPIPVAEIGNIGGDITDSVFEDADNSLTLGTTGTPAATAGQEVWNTNVFTQTPRNAVRDLAYLFTNSLGDVNTPYWAENFDQVNSGTAGWQDMTTQRERIREMVYTDYALFAKDDFKVTRNLTLNLGIRYEYYMPPYITSGLTSTVLGQGNGLFGIGRSAGASFNNWLHPGSLFATGYGTNGTGAFTNGLGSGAQTLACSTTPVGDFANRLPAPNCDPNLQSVIEFIGPNSPNENKTIIPRDRNNFGPAVGFAWQVPWFGAGKTTVRGGYQVTFQRVNIGEGTLASALGGNLDEEAADDDAAITNITVGENRAVLLSDLPRLVPVPPSRAPGQQIPLFARSASFQAYDPNFVTPYTQNLTLSVTRSLTRQLTLDVRYVGSLTRKSTGSLSLNASTALHNDELMTALREARQGGNPVLLDELLAGLDLAPGLNSNTAWRVGSATGSYPTDRLYGPVGTCTALPTVAGSTTPPLPADPLGRCPAGQFFNSGAEHLRRGTIYSTSDDLANGNFAGVANILNGGTAPTGGLQPLNLAGAPTPSSRVIRNGCDRIANGLYDATAAAVYPTVEARAQTPAPPAAQNPTFGNVTAGNIPTRCFPANYLTANPQLNGATYVANLGRNNFHSMQVGLSMRPVQGVSFQANYTWAKSMLLPGSGYNDPLNREFDRQQGNERAHDFRVNGTVELPIGPNKLLFSNSSGWVARLIERWQTSFIMNMSTGSPTSVTGAQSTRYASGAGFPPTGNARWVPTAYWQTPKGKVVWNGPSGTGTYYGLDTPGNIGSYVSVPDPQCLDNSQVVQADSKGFQYASNATGCTMRALAQRVPIGSSDSFLLDPLNPIESAARYVLVNPKPGEYGVLSPSVLTSFGNFSLDANAQKSFAITESKQLTIRVDATNVLNHPQPFIPFFAPGGQGLGTFPGLEGSGHFGEILCGCGDHKSGNRSFQAQVRLSF